MRPSTCARAKDRGACGWRSTMTPSRVGPSNRSQVQNPSPMQYSSLTQNPSWRQTWRKEKLMSDNYLKNVIEAALLAAARPVSVSELQQIFDEQSRPNTKEMRAILESLTADYEGRGVTIKETANGYRFQVRNEFSAEVSRLWPDRPKKYSRALLETLALIAYRQPITRA